MANKLIIFLSDTRGGVENAEKHIFTSPEGSTLEGRQTNEAPTKYIISLLKNKEETLENIIYIATEKSKKNWLKYFKEDIENFCKELKVNIPKFQEVMLDLDNVDINSTLNKIANLVKVGDKLYLDTTGGTRDISNILVLATRMLQYKGAELSLAVYANINSEKKSIEDVTYIYDLLQLINGTNEFTGFANSTTLEKYFIKTNPSKKIKSLLRTMNQFAEAMSLCRMDDAYDIFKDLNNNLLAISEKDFVTESKDKDGGILFYHLLAIVKEKFNLNINCELSYLNIIKWCTENNMIQQALTMYVEKIPEYIIKNKGYITVSEKEYHEMKKQLSSHENIYVKIFYEGFLVQKKEEELTDFVKAIDDSFINSILFATNPNIRTKKEYSAVIDENLPERIKLGLENLFKVATVIYDGDRLNPDKTTIKRKLKQMELNEQIIEFACKIKNSDIFSLKNEIASDNKIVKIFLEEDIHGANISEKKAYNIENLESNEDFKINIDLEKMQTICTDYIFFKLLRNQINHANQKSNSLESLNVYFKKRNYPTEERISLSKTKECLFRALQNLEVE